jgi:hypothetical protein
MEERWKMIYLARRNPALAAEDFPQAWREHSALGRQCRNVQDKVRAVRQCSRVLGRPGVPAGAYVDYDGVNLLWLRDRQAADDIWNDEETLRIMRPDEPRVFATYVRDFTMVAQEQVLRDGEETGTCLALFLRAASDCVMSADDFDSAQDLPWQQAQRVVWNTVSGNCPPGYEYAAIVEAWFESVDAVAAAFGDRSVWSCLPAGLLARLEAAGSVCMMTYVTHRRP